jgi:hypothetical protein
MSFIEQVQVWRGRSGILLASIFVLMLNSGAAAQERVHYLGSFTNLRVSQSGHVYVYELRLWQAGSALHGALLVVAGLEGGGIPPTAEAITEGSLSTSGGVVVKTVSYSFSGRYIEGSLAGELRQGSEIIWGGEDASNRMALHRGTNVQSVPEPTLATVQEIQAWVAKLR